MSSILTNNGAMVALQTMKSINSDLGNIQDMISTGKKVADAKDNAAVWAISTVMESDVSSFKAVGDSLALGQSTVAVARNASEQVTDLLEEMKTKIVSSQEENVDREKIQADISALRDQVKSVVGAAQFNGLNMLKGNDDVNILSSLDRASNGSVTTSEIGVARNNLDSGTANVAGTEVISGGTAAGTAELAGGVTEKDLAQFTAGSTTLTLAGATGLDAADSATLTIDLDGGSAGANVLTLTYAGATGTASEIASEIEEAFDAWKADSTATTTGNVTIGITEASVGNANNIAQNIDFANPGDGSALTVTDNRERATEMDYAFTFTDTAASTFTVTDSADDDGDVDLNATETLTIAGDPLGTGDTYKLDLTRGGETISLTYTATTSDGSETAASVASELENAYSAWLADEGQGNVTSYDAANGTSTIAITHSGATGTDAASFTQFDGVGITDGGGGVLTVDNTDASAAIGNLAITVGETLTTPRTTNDLNITEGNSSTFNTGEVDATDGSIEATIAGTATEGEEYSVTIEGLDDPVTYTVQAGETATTIAENFSAAINNALSSENLDGVIETSAASGVITFSNYSTTDNREISALTVSVPDADAAEVLDSEGNATTAIAAGETTTFSFGERNVNEGDTYNIKFGETDVTYVAGKNDDLNDVATNLSGLAKLATGEDVSIEVTPADDPESSAVTLSVTNNGTTDIENLETSVKAGGTVNGGLSALDEIDVSSNLKAEGSLEIIGSLIQTAIDASADFGSSEKRLEIQQEFISKLTDSMTAGIGTLVDANMEETAARLQALQVQQQLGTQALSIANQAPQNVLALFR